jgi:hypothetical protein
MAVIAKLVTLEEGDHFAAPLARLSALSFLAVQRFTKLTRKSDGGTVGR